MKNRIYYSLSLQSLKPLQKPKKRYNHYYRFNFFNPYNY